MLIFILLLLIVIIICIIMACSATNVEPKSDRIPTSLYNWLEEADEGYIRTFCLKDTKYFAPFATTDVIEEVYDEINQKPEKLFGTKRYRTRRWSMTSALSTSFTLIKRLTHAHIDVGAGVRVPLGDNIEQEWIVQVTKTGYVLTAIKEL